MPAQKVTITVNTQAQLIVPGARRGQDLISLANLALGEQLLLEVQADVDIPVAAADILIVRGGEVFSVGDGNPVVPDNPRMRNPVTITLNEAPFPPSARPPVAKLSIVEIKALAHAVDADLWVDLDGLADELLDDGDRIIVRPADRFFTVARELDDKFYEVTVLLDGEERESRFPAAMTVRNAIRRSLPPRDRPHVDEFIMVDSSVGPQPLEPDHTLKAAGVRDHHVLSITKKNGGGG